MALNLYMHNRNPYKTKKPSFRKLVQKYPFFSEAFAECEDGKTHAHFKQPKFLAALARALLMDDFGLDVEIPLDRLIPTIPLRMNYILWIEDILAALSPFSYPPTILDIGTGSCCIYPIIGAKKNGWNFIGSECDSRNFQHSLETVQRNNLSAKIKLIRIHDDTAPPLQPIFDDLFSSSGVSPSQTMIDIVMANPPFFENVADAIGADSFRSFSRPPPKSASSAARTESLIAGGEVGFARRLAEDSMRYKDNVKVFTLMLGKKRSVPAVRRIMQELQITQTSVYEMCQGRVMRWGFAWTFVPNFKFPVSEFRQKRKFHRPPLTYTLPPKVSCLEKYTRKCLLEWIRRQLIDLKMRVILQKNKRSMGGCHLRAKAREDTWTHSRRKRREALMKQKQSEFNQHDHQIDSGERKRSYSTDENGVNAKENRPAKRCRMDEICDGDMSWIEELYEDYTDADGEVILIMDVYVESQQKGYGGDSSNGEDCGELSDFDDGDNIEDLRGEKINATVGRSDVDRLIISVNWVGGTDREQANRVLCYLKNRLK